MKFTIETLNDSGSGMKYANKEGFLRELSMMIDDCISNGGTFFDVQVDSDVSCFFNEEGAENAAECEEPITPHIEICLRDVNGKRKHIGCPSNDVLLTFINRLDPESMDDLEIMWVKQDGQFLWNALGSGTPLDFEYLVGFFA